MQYFCFTYYIGYTSTELTARVVEASKFFQKLRGTQTHRRQTDRQVVKSKACYFLEEGRQVENKSRNFGF
jgi:hypothetical protein